MRRASLLAATAALTLSGGLAIGGVATANPPQRVSAGSVWTLAYRVTAAATPDIAAPTCQQITFVTATTWTGSIGDAGTWSGGRGYIELKVTSPAVGLKYVAGYHPSTADYPGHFADSATGHTKLGEADLTDGATCPAGG